MTFFEMLIRRKARIMKAKAHAANKKDKAAAKNTETFKEAFKTETNAKNDITVDNRSCHDPKATDFAPDDAEKEASKSSTSKDSNIFNFAEHLSKYMEETVTVFVKCGGESGVGFTGVLSEVTDSFICLIVRTVPPPICPFSPNKYIYHGLSYRPAPAPSRHSTGNKGSQCFLPGFYSKVYIPIYRIAAFVHSL